MAFDYEITLSCALSTVGLIILALFSDDIAASFYGIAVKVWFRTKTRKNQPTGTCSVSKAPSQTLMVNDEPSRHDQRLTSTSSSSKSCEMSVATPQTDTTHDDDEVSLGDFGCLMMGDEVGSGDDDDDDDMNPPKLVSSLRSSMSSSASSASPFVRSVSRMVRKRVIRQQRYQKMSKDQLGSTRFGASRSSSLTLESSALFHDDSIAGHNSLSSQSKELSSPLSTQLALDRRQYLSKNISGGNLSSGMSAIHASTRSFHNSFSSPSRTVLFVTDMSQQSPADKRILNHIAQQQHTSEDLSFL